jgi:hypothetical protein
VAGGDDNWPEKCRNATNNGQTGVNTQFAKKKSHQRTVGRRVQKIKITLTTPLTKSNPILITQSIL